MLFNASATQRLTRKLTEGSKSLRPLVLDRTSIIWSPACHVGHARCLVVRRGGVEHSLGSAMHSVFYGKWSKDVDIDRLTTLVLHVDTIRDTPGSIVASAVPNLQRLQTIVLIFYRIPNDEFRTSFWDSLTVYIRKANNLRVISLRANTCHKKRNHLLFRAHIFRDVFSERNSHPIHWSLQSVNSAI